MRIAWLVLLVACNGKGQRPDGGMGLDGLVIGDGSLIDAPFACANDSALEPNDTIANAFVTSVDTQGPMVSLTGLAICPATDRDHFQITLSAPKAIEIIASWDSGPILNLSILNAAGTSLANGTLMGTNAKRVCVPNLPEGTYFGALFVFGSIPNNYRLSIKTLASCP
jgi:hypothetical protein